MTVFWQTAVGHLITSWVLMLVACQQPFMCLICVFAADFRYCDDNPDADECRHVRAIFAVKKYNYSFWVI